MRPGLLLPRGSISATVDPRRARRGAHSAVLRGRRRRGSVDRGLYMIDRTAPPCGSVFCLAKRFSITCRQQLLVAIPLEARQAALGAELRRRLPHDVRGTARIRRGDRAWEKPFLIASNIRTHRHIEPTLQVPLFGGPATCTSILRTSTHRSPIPCAHAATFRDEADAFTLHCAIRSPARPRTPGRAPGRLL